MVRLLLRTRHENLLNRANNVGLTGCFWRPFGPFAARMFASASCLRSRFAHPNLRFPSYGGFRCLRHFWIRKQLHQRHRQTVITDYAAMCTIELAWFVDAAAVRDDADFVHQVGGVVEDALALVEDHQSALQFRVLRGDAGGTRVAIALQRLDATQRKHEAPR